MVDEDDLVRTIRSVFGFFLFPCAGVHFVFQQAALDDAVEERDAAGGAEADFVSEFVKSAKR